MTQRKPPTPTTASQSVPEQANEGLAMIGELYLNQGDASRAIDAFAAAGATKRLEPIAKDCLLSGRVPEALKAYSLAGIDPPRDLLVTATWRLANTTNNEDLIAAYAALDDVAQLTHMGGVLLDGGKYRLAAKAFAGARHRIPPERLLESIASHILNADSDDAYAAVSEFPGAIRPDEFIAFGDRMRDKGRYPAAVWAYGMGRDDASATERLGALGRTLLEGDDYPLACRALELACHRPPLDLLIAFVLRALAAGRAGAVVDVYEQIADDVDQATHVMIADGFVDCGYVQRAIAAYQRGRHALKGKTLARICGRLLLDREYSYLRNLGSRFLVSYAWTCRPDEMPDRSTMRRWRRCAGSPSGG